MTWTCKQTSQGLDFYCDGVKASASQAQALFASMQAENNHLRLELESTRAQVAKFKRSARAHYGNEFKKDALFALL